MNLIKENILTYSIKYRKNTENLGSKIFKTNNNRLIIQPKCSKLGNKKSIFMKKLEAKGLLSSLGVKRQLNKIRLLGNVLF